MSSCSVRGVVALFFCLVLGQVASNGLAEDESGPLFDPLGGISDALGSPVQISAAIELSKDGGPDVLAVTAVLEDGWHLYSLDQGKGARKSGGPKATVIRVAEDSSQVPVGQFKPDVQPERRPAKGVPSWEGLVLEEHHGRVTWRASLKGNSGGSTSGVHGTVFLQLCQDTACMPPEQISFKAIRSASRPVGDEEVSVSHVPERGHVAIDAALMPEVRQADGSVCWPVVVRLVPEAGWHLYSPSSTASSDVGQGKPTICSLPAVDNAAVRVVRLTANQTQAAISESLSSSGAVDGPIVLSFLIGLVDGAVRGADRDLEFLVGFQTCSDTTCDQPWAARVQVAIPEEGHLRDGSIECSDARYAEAAQAPADIEVPKSVSNVPAVSASGEPVGFDASIPLSLPAALLAGLVGGLILNLMPCVLPVLGLKLMSFAQQSGKERREVLRLNLWYCAGLYAVFFVLAILSVAANVGLAESNLAWGEQFTSWRFNVTMTGIVFAFALSFLGVWELPIPGFIGVKAGRVQAEEGAAGSFLKGVLSTLLATPCSGPFLGPVFGFTLTQSTSVTFAIFGSIATGMALPYILVGLFPGLVKFLPKPGPWMETLKEVLGFVMLGTVAYLFTFLSHDYFVPTFTLLIGIWAACWWVGKGQESGGGSVGFGRWCQAASVAVVIGTLSFFFLGPVESLIEWQPFSRQRLTELQAEGATVLVDFSADWCPTCKYNLATAIETRKVKAAIEENRVVPMLADWTDGSPEIKDMLASLQSKSIPVLAVFPALQPGKPLGSPIVLRDLITESQVLAAIRDAGPSRPGLQSLRTARRGEEGLRE
ncbi:MAG: thioredoxin family protein [Pirellulales bacterium]